MILSSLPFSNKPATSLSAKTSSCKDFLVAHFGQYSSPNQTKSKPKIQAIPAKTQTAQKGEEEPKGHTNNRSWPARYG